jgi:hypothetical protein
VNHPAFGRGKSDQDGFKGDSVITTQTEQAIRDGVTFIESFNVHDGDVHNDLLEAADTHAALVAALRDSVDVLVGHNAAFIVKQAYEKAIAALAKAEGA